MGDGGVVSETCSSEGVFYQGFYFIKLSTLWQKTEKWSLERDVEIPTLEHVHTEKTFEADRFFGISKRSE